MTAARDEARARIAARMARDTRRGAPVAQEAAQAPAGASARGERAWHARRATAQARGWLLGELTLTEARAAVAARWVEDAR